MISFERIFYAEIHDVSTGKNLRIFGDREGDTVYIEQGNSMIELDKVTQGQLAKFLVNKMALELTQFNIPKDITDNI